MPLGLRLACFGKSTFLFLKKEVPAHLQKLGDKELAFARRKILQQSSTLIIHLYFSSTLSFCTFLKKYQKQGSRVRHSVLKVDNIAFSHPVRCKLRLHCARLYAVNVVDLQSKFKSRFATSLVGSRLAPRCLSQCLGWQELAALKHHATCFQALLGCSLCLPTLPFRFQRRITFCNKNSLVCITDFNAHYANILKPAPSKSQQTAGQAEETGQNLFERCIYAMRLLREKRVVLSPMLERTAVCGK